MDDKLTVAEALKHARHDFLNKLQLIKMHADLGKTDRISGLIRDFADMAQVQNCLARLEMPETEEWLLTAGWRFQDIEFRLECAGKEGAPPHDAVIRDSLEKLFVSVCEEMDGGTEAVCTLRMCGDKEPFCLEITLDGITPAVPDAPDGNLEMKWMQSAAPAVLRITPKTEG
ncbi:Spo0B domain-containing protein [Indiicoccus explosivorum]|uniref:Spo0B domain-containing protein n=1 Tax=Indiicoccus explosivorum TaxID=1917864 RepID=UPI000B453068|nr:Spo0B domain-containing protein [Indiicoccus explosivorum]